MSKYVGPRQSKLSMVALTQGDTNRLRAFVRKHGTLRAKSRLGISTVTFENSLDFGLMRPDTRDKVLDCLAREEVVDASVPGPVPEVV